MKKIILLLFTVITAQAAIGQSFHYITGPNTDDTGMAPAQFSTNMKFQKNQAGDPITFRWKMISVDTLKSSPTSDVVYGICDNNLCYTDFVNKEKVMTPISGTSSYGQFKLQCFSTTGDIKICAKIRVWDDNDPTLEDTVTMCWRTDGWVGIEEYTASAKMSVFPNPASDVLNVTYDVNELANTKFELVSVLGNTVYQKSLSAKSGTINLNISKLPRGIYFYSIKGESGKAIMTKKLVIQ